MFYSYHGYVLSMHVEHFGPDKPFQVNTIYEENIND